MTRSKLIFAAYAAIAGCFLATYPVAAQAPYGTETKSAIVAHGDLNLASVAGQAALKARIERAARRVCARRGAVPLHEWRAESDCRKEAMANVAHQVARLTNKASIYARRTDQSRLDR